jgi:putative ABC transport system permease protein
MDLIALKMLTGDIRKYLAIVFGVAFATLLMSQQMSIFCGLMLNTTSIIRDARGVDLWVMAEGTQYMDDIRPLPEDTLERIRGVAGVKWAVRFYKGQLRANLPDGTHQSVYLLGVDDDSLVGTPPDMVMGSWDDLRRPDAVVIDEFGFKYLFPGREKRLGDTIEINERRGIIVGICKVSPPFITLPVMYTRYRTAMDFAPPQRRQLSFVLVKAADGVAPAELCDRIAATTGLKALTSEDFAWSNVRYYIRRTGIPVNFGITVALGFVVGCAVAGQTFYLFVLEHLRQFGMLKAMGVGNLTLLRMVLLQALVVGTQGFGLGIGLASLTKVLFEKVITNVPPVFFMPWQVMAGTAAAVIVIVLLAGGISLRTVMRLEPAVVFK